MKVIPPPITEDLSRFGRVGQHPASLDGARRGGRASAKLRALVPNPRPSYAGGPKLEAFWRECWKRRFNAPMLANAVGISVSWLRQILQGQPGKAYRAAIIKQLKPNELAALGWKGTR